MEDQDDPALYKSLEQLLMGPQAKDLLTLHPNLLALYGLRYAIKNNIAIKQVLKNQQRIIQMLKHGKVKKHKLEYESMDNISIINLLTRIELSDLIETVSDTTKRNEPSNS
jgi:hypothetical protein